jgi:energy-coupling factor transporter ATP-binding protein EcfA2
MAAEKPAASTILKEWKMQKEYSVLLAEIQQDIRGMFWQVIDEKASQKTNAVLAIQRYLLNTNSTVENMSSEDLIGRLYNDIFAYSVLSDPLENLWITKIRVINWNNIWVEFQNGKARKIDSFANQQQAEEAIDRLLADSELKTDTPFLCGKLKDLNARITVFRPPVVSEGIRCIIEKPVQRIFTTKDYLADGFTVNRELTLLGTALQHGVSILLTGQSGCGKTAFTEYLTDLLPEEANAIVLESGSREIVSSRELLLSEKELDEFICKADGMGCDILAFNFRSWLSLKAAESIPTVIAQSVGVDPVCGIHNMADDITCHCCCDYLQATLRICAAFPLIVYLGKLPDRKHRILSISETACKDGQIILTPIWQFQVDLMDTDGSEAVIHGHHKQTGEISTALLDRMKLHGITSEEIQKIKRSEKSCLKEEQSDAS